MKTRFAICIDNAEYPASLEIHKIYRVIPDQDAEQNGDLRIIDESGEDYIYPGRYFLTIDLPQETERVLMDSFERMSLTGIAKVDSIIPAPVLCALLEKF
jgi:hypothetical protein